MNRKQLFATLAALLALLLGVGVSTGQEPETGAQAPEEPVTITAMVDSRISYQGLLKEGVNPVTGTRDMIFRLYSNDTCSTQVGSNIVESGVQVTDGLFSVELDVAHRYFNGQGLWLEVEVGGTKIGCQEILPVPYALSLRPGATIEDTTSEVHLNYSSGKTNNWSKSGLHATAEGTAANTTYRGVYGRGTDYGVFGYSESGAAIYGAGDVKQNLEGNGLIKAAVHTYCGLCLSCTPERSFNNVTADSILCICGGTTGYCAVDFGFDISDRFWVATAVDTGDIGVTCESIASDQLGCTVWDATNGTGTDRYIMVLVY